MVVLSRFAFDDEWNHHLTPLEDDELDFEDPLLESPQARSVSPPQPVRRDARNAGPDARVDARLPRENLNERRRAA